MRPSYDRQTLYHAHARMVNLVGYKEEILWRLLWKKSTRFSLGLRKI